MVDDRTDAARFESCQAENAERILIERGLAHDLIVRDNDLPADEPITADAIEIAADHRANVVFRLQRHSRAEVVVIVVLDLAAHDEAVNPVMVFTKRRSRERRRPRGIGGGVLRRHSENRQLRLQDRTCAGSRPSHRATCRASGSKRRSESTTRVTPHLWRREPPRREPPAAACTCSPIASSTPSIETKSSAVLLRITNSSPRTPKRCDTRHLGKPEVAGLRLLYVKRVTGVDLARRSTTHAATSQACCHTARAGAVGKFARDVARIVWPQLSRVQHVYPAPGA